MNPKAKLEDFKKMNPKAKLEIIKKAHEDLEDFKTSENISYLLENELTCIPEIIKNISLQPLEYFNEEHKEQIQKIVDEYQKEQIFIEKFQVIVRTLTQYVKDIYTDEKTLGVDITKKGRHRIKSDLLKIFCKNATTNLKFTLTDVGRFLNRSHATILHAVRKYDSLFITDPDFRELAEYFMDKFNGFEGTVGETPNRDATIQLIKTCSEDFCNDLMIYAKNKLKRDYDIKTEELKKLLETAETESIL